MSVDYGDTDAEVIQYHNTYNLEFPSISGIEGGGNAIFSAYGIPSTPTYILIAPNHEIVEQDMWPISSTQSFITYFTNNGLEQSPCGPPACSQAVSPLDLSVDVPLDISLEWDPIPGATGYRINFGTDNPPTSIENGTDLGDLTSYTPVVLDYQTDYYWQVVPYNYGGMPGSCQVFQFTTTAHIIALNLKAFLEGPFNSIQMVPHLNTSGYLPLDQPYNISPWNYTGTESVGSIPGNVVDWVLIDILKPYGSGNDLKFEVIDRIPGFILNTGTITDLSGTDYISISGPMSEFHVRIQHRNHLPIVSSVPLTGSNDLYTYSFTSGSNKALGGTVAQKEITLGVWAMIAADGDGNLQVNNVDKNEDWLLQFGMTGYYSADYNMDSDVDDADKMNSWEINLGRGAFPTQDTILVK
jgi:hypothetical protein